MEQRRVILLSGMGGDGRLLRLIRIPDAEILAPDHVEPISGESLSEYAGRIIEKFSIGPEDVIGGVSFGGMVAAEIARQIPVAGLILLGSCVQPERLPWSYPWVEWFGRFVPDVFLRIRSWPPLVRWRFAPLTPEAERCMIQMAADCAPSQLRAFGAMLMGWSGVERFTCPVLSIHGDMDRIIPLSCTEPGIVLKDAGHSFTLTHAEQVNSAILDFLPAIKPKS